jgi:tRNA (guanine-N7-)-methyltransferase
MVAQERSVHMPATATAIHTPSNWLEPLDWRELFGNEHRIELDIGCGKGRVLLWSVQAYPDTNFIGVDRLLRRLRRIDRKIQRFGAGDPSHEQFGLHNVRLIRAEASYFVAYLVPKASVSAYHIYFPDPWPKRRHRQRRLMSGAFLRDLHRTLERGGEVNCATDHDEYFRWIQAEFGRSSGFMETNPHVLTEATQTDFEREFLSAGKQIYRCCWVKG